MVIKIGYNKSRDEAFLTARPGRTQAGRPDDEEVVA